jgi:hypothetical protein
MNIENKIEISLAKLRVAWKQAKSKAAKDRITFVARTLKQGISGSLIPLTMKIDSNRNFAAPIVKQPNESEMPNFTDESWYNIRLFNDSLRS